MDVTTHGSSGGRHLLQSLLTMAVAGATLAAVTTNALFSETDSVGSNTFVTGSVDIATNPTSAIVADSSMAPGDTSTGSVTVTNSGSLEQRYAITSTTSEGVLAAQLDLTIWAEAAEASTGDGCSATPPATKLYDAGALGSTAGTNVVGDPTQGSQAGDRTLAAGGSEVLCFLVSLPSSTDSTFEGITSTATFAFQAEQTANNA